MSEIDDQTLTTLLGVAVALTALYLVTWTMVILVLRRMADLAQKLTDLQIGTSRQYEKLYDRLEQVEVRTSGTHAALQPGSVSPGSPAR